MKVSGICRKKCGLIILFAIISLFFTSPVFAAGIQVMPDWSVFIQMVNFLFLIWILNLVMYKPIRNVLIQRKEKISGLEKTIETANKDVDEKDEAFSSGIKRARAKGLTEKNDLVSEAIEQEKRIIEKINDKIQANIAEVREKIAQDAKEVQAVLQEEVDSFADAICIKILGRNVG